MKSMVSDLSAIDAELDALGRPAEDAARLARTYFEGDLSSLAEVDQVLEALASTSVIAGTESTLGHQAAAQHGEAAAAQHSEAAAIQDSDEPAMQHGEESPWLQPQNQPAQEDATSPAILLPEDPTAVTPGPAARPAENAQHAPRTREASDAQPPQAGAADHPAEQDHAAPAHTGAINGTSNTAQRELPALPDGNWPWLAEDAEPGPDGDPTEVTAAEGAFRLELEPSPEEPADAEYAGSEPLAFSAFAHRRGARDTPVPDPEAEFEALFSDASDPVGVEQRHSQVFEALEGHAFADELSSDTEHTQVDLSADDEGEADELTRALLGEHEEPTDVVDRATLKGLDLATPAADTAEEEDLDLAELDIEEVDLDLIEDAEEPAAEVRKPPPLPSSRPSAPEKRPSFLGKLFSRRED